MVADYLNDGNDPKDLIGVRVLLRFTRIHRNADPAKEEEEANAFNTAQARMKTITNISTRSAEEKTAYVQDNIVVTVWEHMEKNYKRKDYKFTEQSDGRPASYCVDTNPEQSKTRAWFLAEDLFILPHQLYKRKLGGRLTSLVIQKACRSPKDNINAIVQEGRRAIGAWNKQKESERPESFLELGIKIDPRLVE
jgi:hypothetical protein